jgi:hypothetical protein
MIDFSKFIEKFPPAGNLKKPGDKIINFFEDKLPADLISFWKEYGFGDYGDGIIKVINPEEYADVLGIWLGREKDWSRIPILISGFGDIFYFRQINETAEDVSVVHLHYRKIKVCTDYKSYTLQFFFENYIINDGFSEPFLRKELFEASQKKLGKLKLDEIFFFVPALIMGGGQENINIVEKGNAVVHQDLLFQMGS